MSKRIRVDVKNFNKHTPEGMELLEKSISEVGVIESVTVDAEGEIITGNARKETFDKLGYKPKFIELKENEYPVIQTDLSGEKRVKAAIYANTVAQKNINLDLDLIQKVAIEEYELEFEELGVDFVDVEVMETERLSKLEFSNIYYEPEEILDISLKDCIDFSLFEAKVKRIEQSELSKEQKEVLKWFAFRFLKIDFENVANYYAFNASKTEKEVIEQLRLVLVDGGIDGFIEDDILKIHELSENWNND